MYVNSDVTFTPSFLAGSKQNCLTALTASSSNPMPALLAISTFRTLPSPVYL